MRRYSRRPTGFYTYKRRRDGRKVVRPITPRKRRQALPSLRVVSLSTPKRLASFSINRILTILDAAFPKLIPIFETGRLLINNREKITRFIKNLISDKTTEKKIETIEKNLMEQTEERIASEFSKDSAITVSNLLQEQGCFDAISKEINEDFLKIDADLLQSFFQSTFEGLIKTSITGVLGVAK